LAGKNKDTVKLTEASPEIKERQIKIACSGAGFLVSIMIAVSAMRIALISPFIGPIEKGGGF